MLFSFIIIILKVDYLNFVELILVDLIENNEYRFYEDYFPDDALNRILLKSDADIHQKDKRIFFPHLYYKKILLIVPLKLLQLLLFPLLVTYFLPFLLFLISSSN